MTDREAEELRKAIVANDRLTMECLSDNISIRTRLDAIEEFQRQLKSALDDVLGILEGMLSDGQ